VRTQAHHSFLIVGDASDPSGLQVLQDALSTLGNIVIASEYELTTRLQKESYDMAIVDAGAVSDAENLVTEILRVQPDTGVVVITASPHWKIARAVFRAGATDYLRKSQNSQETRAVFAQLLGLPVRSTHSNNRTDKDLL